MKKRVGTLNNIPIVEGDPNLLTNKELLHKGGGQLSKRNIEGKIEDLGGGNSSSSNGSGNFGGLIWYDITAMIKNNPLPNSIANLFDAILATQGYLTVVNMPDVGNIFSIQLFSNSGFDPDMQTYVGIPSTISNIDTGECADFFVFFDINKEELKRYITNISDILIENITGIFVG